MLSEKIIMKTTLKLFLFVTALLFSAVGIAKGGKPIPVEVFFGNHRIATQVTVNRNFNATTKFGVFASTMTAGEYDNKLNDKNQIDKERNDTESMNSLYLTYNVYKGLGLISGAGLNSSWGFRPFAGARYGYGNKLFSVNVSSGFYLTQSNNSESKVAIQLRPHLTGNWSLLTSVQGMFNLDMDTRKHDRAAFYARLGTSYKAYGFGMATNLDWYGPKKVFKENYGVYISYAF